MTDPRKGIEEIITDDLTVPGGDDDPISWIEMTRRRPTVYLGNGHASPASSARAHSCYTSGDGVLEFANITS